MQGVVHGVGQADDTCKNILVIRENISIFRGKTWKIAFTSAPVEGGEVDPCNPVDSLGQHEDGGDPDDSHGGDAAKILIFKNIRIFAL